MLTSLLHGASRRPIYTGFGRCHTAVSPQCKDLQGPFSSAWVAFGAMSTKLGADLSSVSSDFFSDCGLLFTLLTSQ